MKYILFTFRDLSDNHITELRPGFFNDYPALQTLILSGNKLEKIAPGAFQHLPLQVLELDKNRLSDVRGGDLPVTLRELSLEGNMFTSFPTQLSSLTALQSLNLGRNQLTAVTHNDLRGLNNLLILLLHQNKLRTVEEGALEHLTKLDILDLGENSLKDIPPVSNCKNLRQLLMGGNRVSYIGEDSLAGLVQLQEVSLTSNPLRTVHHRAFSNLPSLTKLFLKEAHLLREFPDLNGTMNLESIRIDRAAITTIPHDLCTVTPRLRTMNFQRNKITELPDLSRCLYLRLLDLSHNQISSLPHASFQSLSYLQDLLLQGNAITIIHNSTFIGLHRLQVLQLEENQITSIHSDAFLPLESLEDINLGSNMFPELPHQGLQTVVALKVHNNRNLREFPSPENFPNIRTLVLSYAYHCCSFLSQKVSTEQPTIHEEVVFDVEGLQDLDPTIWNVSSVWPDTGTNSNFAAIWANLGDDFSAATLDSAASHPTSSTPAHHITCQPLPGPFMPCQDLFDWWTLRCGVWVVFLLALLGNGTVVVVLMFARSKMDVPRFLVTNLAFADFFMGLYLGLLAVVDASTLGEFRMYAIPWQTSVGCQVTGFLGVLSCELSVYTLTVITMERNYAITHAMHLNKRLSLRHAAYIMVLGWLFASTLAFLPLIGISDYRKFAVCLPIETKGAGLAYVVFLMFINGVAFLILMGCYLKIYCAIRGSQAWNTNDSRIAKRMALLVFTDFICWAPIAFFSLTAAFGLHLISLEEAKVFTVFVLPFNSCCNPFLYALLTKQFKKDCVMLCKSIEESRVTRGIGRRRNSSNFSNRQTPANTNSALDNSWRQENQVHHCHINPQEPTKLRHRLRISALKYLFCHKDVEELNSGAEFNCQPGKSAVKSKSKHEACVSSETYSCSWSDTWRRGHAVMSLRLLDRRHHSSWYLSRKPSQDSNLSSSRNDSSATTASTSTWRISRSSVSSDISSSGSRGLGKVDAGPGMRLGSLREHGGVVHIQTAARQITPHHQALLVRQQPGTAAQQSPPTTTAVKVKPCLQRQGAVEREKYIPKTEGILSVEPCPLHSRSDNLSCVYEQDSCEEEEPDNSKDFLNPRCPMTGLTVAFIPRKLSTISSHSTSVARETDVEDPGRETSSGTDIASTPVCKWPPGARCVSLTLLPQSPRQTSPMHFPSEGHLPDSPQHTDLYYLTRLAAPTLVVSSSACELEASSGCNDVEENNFNPSEDTYSRPDSGLSTELEECLESSALINQEGEGDDDVFEDTERGRMPLETHFPLDEPPGETHVLI
ncbi:hypothetical protein Pmani_030718 [Petrolisthes manimaculis]|uniref:G-protein coupled receptors family 1 profile domain-containing protein n=1 Tax=Petrolisthes manimaculis TaxID=1843537 RepID=A0AAE1NX94_9EUCA|nr:hypothetical protein Pmani_030718 [Petrolisthes manimaculis]